MVAAQADRDRLTPFDKDLLSAIQASAGIDGVASSLFRVAVTVGGLHYEWARFRLHRLEALGYIRVERRGAGLPLSIRLTNKVT